MSHRVTDASPADVPLAYQLHQQAVFRPWSRTTFEDCTTPPYQLLIARSDSQFSGYAILLSVLDEATLMDIAVQPDCRGNGVGGSLLDTIITRCQEQSMVSLWLEVRSGNAVAQRLYEQRGFNVQEIRKGYYPSEQGTEDAVIMVRWFSHDN